MALTKTKKISGISCEYWKIITAVTDYRNNTTNVIMGLYCDKRARDDSTNNFIHREAIPVEGVELLRKGLYNKITESRMISKEVDGHTVEVEDNWFADAVPVLEEGQE